MKSDSNGRHKVPSKAERERQRQASTPKRVVRKAKKPAKQSVCGHDPALGCAPKPFMGLIRWTDPKREPDMFTMRVCCTQEGEFAHICMKIPTRGMASIELRPARRPMGDHKGNVADAIKLSLRDPST